MEISEQLLRRRIGSLLPGRSRPVSQTGAADRQSRSQPVDISDLVDIADDEEFLKESYRRILGRECDVSGLVNYLELLRRHVPRRAILLRLIDSEESKARGGNVAGVQTIWPPIQNRRRSFPGRDLAGRFGALMRDLVRRVLFSRFDSIDHRLNYLLHELTTRTDGLTAKTDQSLWTLSEKLDAYTASLSDAQSCTHEELALQSATVRDLHLVTETLHADLSNLKLKIGRLESELSNQRDRFDDLMAPVRTDLQLLMEAVSSLSNGCDEAVAKLNRSSEAVAEVAAKGAAAIESARTSATGSVEDQKRSLDLLAQLNARADAIANGQSGLEEKLMASVTEIPNRIGRSVLAAGSDVLVTEVDGMIVGVPADEWRMAAHHAFRGPMEPGVVRCFCNLIRPGGVVVDVGANVGIYTLFAARLLQGTGKLHSFEPTPRTYRILRDNVQVNGYLELEIIKLHQLAVTDKAGTAQLSIFDRDCGHNTIFQDPVASGRIEVLTTSLDETLGTQEAVDVVKIDAEGAEPLILRGMKKVIERNPRIRILLEFAPIHLRRAGCNPSEFLDEIASLGFMIRRIDEANGEVLPVTREALTEAFSVNLQLEGPV
jgi:FkbM family methyltransferase